MGGRAGVRACRMSSDEWTIGSESVAHRADPEAIWARNLLGLRACCAAWVEGRYWVSVHPGSLHPVRPPGARFPDTWLLRTRPSDLRTMSGQTARPRV